MTAKPPGAASRPRIVDVAFVLWLCASIALVLAGMLLLTARTGLPMFFRGAGGLWALSGLALGYLAGRTRRGQARFRRAAVALSLSLVALLAVFSLASRGVIWLPIMIATMVAAVLIMRPSAQAWFEAQDQRGGAA